MCADRVLVGEGPNNWGRWGKDDERGALNFITDEKRAAAATRGKKFVREGIEHRRRDGFVVLKQSE